MNNDNMTTEGLAFIKGDLVECIDPGHGNGLTMGRVYTVVRGADGYYSTMRVEDAEGQYRTGFPHRFTNASEWEIGTEVQVATEAFYTLWGKRNPAVEFTVGQVATIGTRRDSDGDYHLRLANGNLSGAISALCLEKISTPTVTESELAEWELELMEALDTEDMVQHPQHYMKHPSGLEIIDITRHHNFSIGNALKYIFRHEHKGKPVEDLEKAIKYLQFQIEDIKKAEVAA